MKKKTFRHWFRLAAAVLVMLCASAAFWGFPLFAQLFKLQFVPSLNMFFCGAALSAGAIALLTVLFGRFYCAVLCPLGTMQDLLAFLFFKSKAPAKDLTVFRYIVSGLAFGSWTGGLMLGFMILDPYANFGRIASGCLGGWIALGIAALLSLWRKRGFCNTVCPVGTFLGLIASGCRCHLELDAGNCVNCKMCVKSCPAGCIDLESHRIDDSRCLCCLNCMDACPQKCISFGWTSGKRRSFLKNLLYFFAALGGGFALAKIFRYRMRDRAPELAVLPPGAMEINRFERLCVGCRICVASCPAKIIVSAKKSGGVGSVRLDLEKGFCRYDCNVCSKVCPAGAIAPMPLAWKKTLQIAQVKFDPGSCIVFQDDESCGLCAKSCPTSAVTLRKSGAPKVRQDICIGCGACKNVCPTGAMNVLPIAKQKEIHL